MILVSILKNYDRHIDFWASATDKGQAAAINKGFARQLVKYWDGLNSE